MRVILLHNHIIPKMKTLLMGNIEYAMIKGKNPHYTTKKNDFGVIDLNHTRNRQPFKKHLLIISLI